MVIRHVMFRMVLKRWRVMTVEVPSHVQWLYHEPLCIVWPQVTGVDSIRHNYCVWHNIKRLDTSEW